MKRPTIKHLLVVAGYLVVLLVLEGQAQNPGSGGGSSGSTPAQVNTHNGIVNVVDYGAKCDGVTNDTTSILNAITAAGKGGMLIFPITGSAYSSNYCRVSPNVLAPLAGQTWIGSSPGTGASAAPATFGCITSTMSDWCVNIFNVANVTFERIGMFALNNSVGIGLTSSGSTYITLRNFRSDNFTYGINFNGGSFLSFYDVQAQGNENVNMRLQGVQKVVYYGGLLSNCYGTSTDDGSDPANLSIYAATNGSNETRDVTVVGVKIDETSLGCDSVSVGSLGMTHNVFLSDLDIWAAGGGGWSLRLGSVDGGNGADTNDIHVHNIRIEPFAWELIDGGVTNGGTTVHNAITISQSVTDSEFSHINVRGGVLDGGTFADIIDNGVNTSWWDVTGMVNRPAYSGSTNFYGSLQTTQLTAPINGTFETTPTGGTLHHNTQYCYRVAALDGLLNSTTASTETCVTTAATPAPDTWMVVVHWNRQPGTYRYAIYGRTTGAEQLMATINANIMQWTDYGNLTPSGALPSSNITGKTESAFDIGLPSNGRLDLQSDNPNQFLIDAIGSNLSFVGSGHTVFQYNSSTGQMDYEATTPNSTTAHAFANNTTLTTGHIADFYKDNFSHIETYITSGGGVAVSGGNALASTVEGFKDVAVTAQYTTQCGADAGTSGALSVAFPTAFSATPICHCADINATVKSCGLGAAPSVSAATFEGNGSDVIQWCCTGAQ